MLTQLQQELRDELTQNILPYWMTRMVDNEKGGFYGRIDGWDQLIADAPKGGILNARILWTFSAAYRAVPDPEYLRIADRAYTYIKEYFIDEEYGGTYWMLHADGTPADTKKQIYSQAFFIYALSEYFLASNNADAKLLAQQLFMLIERYSLDKEQNGYLEAFSRDWKLLEDLRLSDKDDNDAKTMNTHLHILEAYTNLIRIWDDAAVENALRNMILLFLDKFISPSGHLILFFDEDWNPNDHIHSYGHDIEASWLLYEAAAELHDSKLLERVKSISLKIAQVTVKEGLQPDGSIVYEKDTLTNHLDTDRHWWPQAEAVVGFFYAYQLTNDATWLDRSLQTWQYIQRNLIDREHGEWYWSIRNNQPNKEEDKAGFWKCPYHNGRMCLELLK